VNKQDAHASLKIKRFPRTSCSDGTYGNFAHLAVNVVPPTQIPALEQRSLNLNFKPTLNCIGRVVRFGTSDPSGRSIREVTEELHMRKLALLAAVSALAISLPTFHADAGSTNKNSASAFAPGQFG